MEKTFFETKSFGVIIQMDESMYSDDTGVNMNAHIPCDKENIMSGFLRKLYDLKIGADIEIVRFIVGHEHGAERGKCHMQIFVSFNQKLRKVIEPGYFYVDGLKLMYIAQHCRSPKKLQAYCKKGGDFIDRFPCMKLKDYLRSKLVLDDKIDLDDPYDYLLKKNDLNETDIKEVFSNCAYTEYKKNFMCNSRQIIETYNKLIKKNEAVGEFMWTFPQHMIEYVMADKHEDQTIYETYACLFDWFMTYCNGDCENVKRRKALFLFSIHGGLGKSCFARSLVPEVKAGESPFYVYCRGTLDGSEFLKKSGTARLVILDDINYISNDIEVWKALAVGEPTNVRSPYHNVPWAKSLPCVMLSNNLKTFKYWMEAEDLKSRCVFISIDFFIGPPGTDKQFFHSFDYHLSQDVKSALGIK